MTKESHYTSNIHEMTHLKATASLLKSNLSLKLLQKQRSQSTKRKKCFSGREEGMGEGNGRNWLKFIIYVCEIVKEEANEYREKA